MYTRPRISQPTEVLSARVPETLSDRIDGLACGLGMSRNELIATLLGRALDDWSSELQPGQSCRLVHTDGSTEFRIRVAHDDYEWLRRLERLLVAHAVEREYAAAPAEKDPS
jgi:hypothetical protein